VSFYDNIMSIVSAVLLLGNIKFDESTYGNDTPCSIKTEAEIIEIAHLIDMAVPELKAAITMK